MGVSELILAWFVMMGCFVVVNRLVAAIERHDGRVRKVPAMRRRLRDDEC